jgi:hypothetical protein
LTAQLLGPEFLVNSYTPSGQARPAVAVDDSGNFVVVWSDYSQESLLDLGIFGQGFDPVAGPLGTEFHVKSFTTSHQQYPAVAASGTNNFLVVWDSNGQDGSARGLFGRRFSAAGLPAGSEFMVNSYTTGYQVVPAAATDSNGFFVVVWNGEGPTDSAGVFGQRFDAVGTAFGGEFQVNTYTTNQQREPAVAADGAGNFVVSWISYGQDDGSNWGVFAQRFHSTGVKAGSEFRVNSYTTSSQFISVVGADDAGNFIVTWEGVGPTDSFGVFGRRFNAAGGAIGGEFQVNAYTTSSQAALAVATNGSGNFVVTWQSGGQDGSGLGVIGRRLTTTVFDHGFEANPPFWSDTTATMCSGFCDSQSSTGCYCDAFCAANGDCCLDTCVTCGYCAP